jgi:O-antigen/teichoic acid export membrane protein
MVSAGNMGWVALGFLANLLLIRGLSPASYGLFAVANGILTLLQEVSGGGLDMAAVRGASGQESREEAAKVATAALQIKLVLNSALAIAVWAAAPLVAVHAFSSPEATFAIRLAGIGALGSCVYSYVLVLLQVEERLAAYSLQRIGNGVLRITMIAGFLLAGRLDLDLAMVVTAGSFVVSSAFGLVLVRRWVQRFWAVNRRAWADLLRFGASVTASRLLFSLYGRMDIFFLGHYRTQEETGIYSVATNLAYMIDLTTYALILTFLPQASRLRSREELGGYCRQTLKASAAFGAASLVLFAAARPIVETLFSSRYGEAAHLFQILFLGCLVTLFVHPLYLILYSRNKPHLLIASDLAMVAAAAVGHPLSIQRFGQEGAAVVTVAARLLGCAVILFLVRREVNSWDRIVPAYEKSI